MPKNRRKSFWLSITFLLAVGLLVACAQPTVEPAAPVPAVLPKAMRKPAPTIQVTIGRIEVRAITLPAPPAPRFKPARPGPALSLDDYLKQRNEGKR